MIDQASLSRGFRVPEGWFCCYGIVGAGRGIVYWLGGGLVNLVVEECPKYHGDGAVGESRADVSLIPHEPMQKRVLGQGTLQ